MKKNFGIIGTVGIVIALSLSACSGGPTNLETVYDTCPFSYEFRIDDDGKVISAQNTFDAVSLYCLLEEIEAPEWFYTKLESTSSLDGWVNDSFGKYDIEWQYYSDYGVSIIVKEK